MKLFITLKQGLRRYFAVLNDVILALDSGPVEFLHAEVYELKQEIVRIKHQTRLSLSDPGDNQQ